jgi:hypothetical protein
MNKLELRDELSSARVRNKVVIVIILILLY